MARKKVAQSRTKPQAKAKTEPGPKSPRKNQVQKRERCPDLLKLVAEEEARRDQYSNDDKALKMKAQHEQMELDMAHFNNERDLVRSKAENAAMLKGRRYPKMSEGNQLWSVGDSVAAATTGNPRPNNLEADALFLIHAELQVARAALFQATKPHTGVHVEDVYKMLTGIAARAKAAGTVGWRYHYVNAGVQS